MKIIALTGGSGSGKSTVLKGLLEHFKGRSSILSLDDYYRPREELPIDSNGETNYDVPQAINHDKLLGDLNKLMNGESVSIETYTYNRDAMKSEVITITPSDWLIVEGLFVMHDPGVRNLFDLTAYIDAAPNTRLERRKLRDFTVRGYDPDEVEYQWHNHVRPADQVYIEPWRNKCDVVIDNEKDYTEGLSELIYKMES
ncbi:MAG: uridine kinase [Crocinitomicaceae bacterium]|nr:uridine kinase [Crocinitomicaceae bacterium]|tara:strand:+ start:3822 stop:4418 length:597 start_codon:yes stop_codon:yes gene_type:complete